MGRKKKIVESNGYWVDCQDNKWHCNILGKEDAQIESNHLFNCTKCVDCKDCVDCETCSGCYDCNDCIDCKDCEDCISCGFVENGKNMAKIYGTREGEKYSSPF